MTKVVGWEEGCITGGVEEDGCVQIIEGREMIDGKKEDRGCRAETDRKQRVRETGRNNGVFEQLKKRVLDVT